MTQRRAVFVGCRLIAVYMVIESLAAVMSAAMTMGWVATTTGGLGQGGSVMPTGYVINYLLVPALGKAGLGVFVWALAGGIARAAALPEDSDDL